MKIVGISGAVVLFCLCMFIACAHMSSQIEPSSSDSATEGFIPGLQSPADVQAGMPPRATSAFLLERNGNAFEEGLEHLVNAEGTSARFSPKWTDAGQMAVAIYRFNVQGYTVSEIQLDWGEAPVDTSNLWIGLSNWSSNRWDWHPGTPDGVLFLGYDGYADFPKPDSGEMLVAIVMLGTEPALLDRLQVGENQQGDWMFGHDPQHTRRSPFVGTQTNNVKWLYTTGSVGESSPAIAADGTVFVGSYDGKLYAINPDGSFKWSYTTGGSVFSSPAIGADGAVYVGSYDGKLYAINPDGSFKWSYTTEDWVSSSPAIAADGTMYVGSYDDKLHAINPDGTILWSYTTGDDVYSSPAIGADGTVYVGSRDGKLYAINQDGSFKWSYTTGSVVLSSPAIAADGTVYVGSHDGKLYAINPDGTLLWSYTTGGGVYSSPAIAADGTVYVGSFNYKLYAINLDGTLLWSYTTGGGVDSSPAIGSDATVYVASADGKLYAFGD